MAQQNEIVQMEGLMEAEANSSEEIEKMESAAIGRRGLPAELLAEIFAALPLENATGLLDKMANGLLARKVQKMYKNVKNEMVNNKWNPMDCGPKLDISSMVFVMNSSGFTKREYGSTVRASLPVPKFYLMNASKPYISCYFEVHILSPSSIKIGFCSKQFPLNMSYLGCWHTNSIGFSHKGRMACNGQIIDLNNFDYNEGFFKSGDVVGIGLINFSTNSPMKCFVTSNGNLLGSIDLAPGKFHGQLFPAVTLRKRINSSIKANFGKEMWRYNPRQFIIQ